MLTQADFDWQDYFWVAPITLASLSGPSPRFGPYDFKHRGLQSGGVVDLTFAPEGRDDSPLKDSEIDLARWYMEYEAEVLEAALSGILAVYESEKEKNGYTEEELAEFMPAVHCLDDLRKLLGLRAVNIHQITNDDLPYIGLEFACTWDDEHGVGVLLNGTNVVEVGGADTAILLWIAKQHAQETP